MSRLLFTSPVELLRTESTLGEFYLGEKPNLLRIELEKRKIYAVKKVNPTTFSKQFNKKDAVKYISFCPLASYQGKGKEIPQTANKTLNSSGHFSKPWWLLPSGYITRLPEQGSILPTAETSAAAAWSGIAWVVII